MKRSLRVLLCTINLISLSAAQSIATPLPGDPNLYYGALRYIRAVHLHSLAASDPKETATTQLALRNQLQISEGDYSILVREAAVLDDKGGVTQKSQSEKTSVEASTAEEQSRSAAVIDRLAATSQVLQKLNTELSAVGMKSFQAFVNGTFRQSTKIIHPQQ